MAGVDPGRRFADPPAERQSDTAQGAARRVRTAINYMTEHVNQPLRVSTLTALTGLSASQLFVLFKVATGFTPMNYFIRLRIRRACELLGDPNLSVKEIAFLLGYSDPGYFSRIFKLLTGVAPCHYRNRTLDLTPENVALFRYGARLNGV